MKKCKSIGITSILCLCLFLGVFTIYGTDIVTGTPVSGRISVDTVWDITGSPYIVTNDAVVDSGVTLTIDPGVEVKFETSGIEPFSIYVEGTLISLGEVNLTIHFTSNSPTPQPLDWRKIQVNSSGHIDMSFTRIAYSTFGVVIHSSNNTLTDNYFLDSGAAMNLEPPGSHNYVANNTAENNLGNFIAMGASSYNVIENNTVLNIPSPIIGFDTWKNRIDGNTIVNCSNAIKLLWTANNNTIANNTIENASERGIYLFGVGYDTVENNTISMGSGGTGVEIQSNFHVNVLNNTITGFWRGVYYGSMRNSHHTFIGNNVSHNVQGMHVGYSDNNTIARNDFALNSEFGLRMMNTSNNRIYHNSFFENRIQASDSHVDNSWDDGYPSGGNYWSDYSSNDSYRGPNQDIMGSDGIGDNPYFINSSGIDKYPLTEPSGAGTPPRNLSAHLSGLDYENVTIAWNLSWNDGQRANDITRYEVYRAPSYDRQRLGYQLIGTTPNQTAEFVDNYSGEGDPSNYFYFVCAVNVTGDMSCGTEQVGKFVRPLPRGWNLISFPLETAHSGTEHVLATVPIEIVRYYDASDFTDHWKEFTDFKPYNDLPRLNLTMGLWIKISEDGNLTVAGIVPEMTRISLKQGWNLIGYPCLSAMLVKAVLDSGLDVMVEGFNSTSEPFYLKSIYGDEQLLPGHGYWFRAASESLLEFTN